MEPKDFGRYLRSVREAFGYTLRTVEEKASGRVKNAYLSQIENGQITLPSPAILWVLAEVYGVDYGELLLRAGHRVPESSVATRKRSLAGLPLHALADLDEEDRRELLSFLGYLQTRKKGI